MAWNLKRLTAVVAMLYGLTTLGTAAYAYYLERNWYQDGWRDSAAMEAEVTDMIRQHGVTPDLQEVLNRISMTMGWSAGYITEANSGPAFGDPLILAATGEKMAGHTWNELEQAYRVDDLYWRGPVDRTYQGPDGKRYILWGVLDRQAIPWPVYNQIALVTAVAAWLALATYLNFDVQERRGTALVGWTLLGVLTGPVGLAVWLAARPAAVPQKPDGVICPGCGRLAPVGAGFCPRCGFALQPVCPECRRPVELDWTYCAACGEPLDAGRPAERSHAL